MSFLKTFTNWKFKRKHKKNTLVSHGPSFMQCVGNTKKHILNTCVFPIEGVHVPGYTYAFLDF